MLDTAVVARLDFFKLGFKRGCIEVPGILQGGISFHVIGQGRVQFLSACLVLFVHLGKPFGNLKLGDLLELLRRLEAD
ncbi:MAG: hypothetical protein ACLTQI_02705 [Slackia sp.]